MPLKNEIKFYSERQLLGRLGYSRATLWRQRKRGAFPDPVQISPGRKGYEAEAADAAIAALVNNANAEDGENGEMANATAP